MQVLEGVGQVVLRGEHRPEAAARVVLDERLAAARVGTLQRDPEAPLDAVRIMTVHGAKGLQAPVVVLQESTVQGLASLQSVLSSTWPVGALQPISTRPSGLPKLSIRAPAVPERPRMNSVATAAVPLTRMRRTGATSGPAATGASGNASFSNASGTTSAGNCTTP